MSKYFLLIFIAFASCKAPQQATTQQYTRDSTIIKEVPVFIEVPGATVQSPSINIDSLVQLIKAGVKPEIINNTLISEDPETKLRVGILIDELGNLTALCEQQDRLIESLTQEVTHWKERYEKTTIQKEPTFWQNLKGSINTLGIILILIIAALITFSLLRR